MRYFITYGTQEFSDSRERICREISPLGYFDKTIIYTPNDFSFEFSKHPALKIAKGAGLWVWKPYFILKTIKEIEYGDELFYIDCGSSVYQSDKWEQYFRYLKKYDILAFNLGVKCYQYTKRSVLDYYSNEIGPYWGHFNQITATAIFFKKTELSVNVIEEWFNSCSIENLKDPEEDELGNEHLVEHRYDQAMLSAILYKHDCSGKIKIIQQEFEGKRKDQAIRTTRISNKKYSVNSINQVNWLKTHFTSKIRKIKEVIEYKYWSLCNMVFMKYLNIK